MSRVRRVLLGGAAAVALITAGTTATASAATGVPSGPPPAENGWDVWCVSVTGAKACFASYGDRVWVKDTKTNGHSVAATIKSDPSHSHWGRECLNTRGADGGWVMCNFDVPEFQPGKLWVIDQPWIGDAAYTAISTGNTA
ncbi:hypothetical protein [Kribbella sp. NPDC048928]|uniref:hypothetical protein n=1 Tax=Kribbella sp. NPDC048928 TaxID=3364111 RepID=UPI003722A19A